MKAVRKWEVVDREPYRSNLMGLVEGVCFFGNQVDSRGFNFYALGLLDVRLDHKGKIIGDE